MNILIMGATGYLGRHVLDLLYKEHSIFILCHKKGIADKENIVSVAQDEYLQVFEEHQIDWLVNCIGVYQREENKSIMEGNLIFPLQVMDAAIAHGVKNIVNINTALPENLNLYSFTKRELGRFGRFYSEQYSINFYNLLVEMFYGPDEPSNRFFSSIICKMKQGVDVELTEGLQKRDIIRVEDVCQAVQVIMDSNLKGYHDIPVGTGEGHSIREIIEFLHERMHSSSKLLFGAVPMRKNEPDSIADITCLTELGYKTEYSWKKGLEEMLG